MLTGRRGGCLQVDLVVMRTRSAENDALMQDMQAAMAAAAGHDEDDDESEDSSASPSDGDEDVDDAGGGAAVEWWLEEQQSASRKGVGRTKGGKNRSKPTRLSRQRERHADAITELVSLLHSQLGAHSLPALARLRNAFVPLQVYRDVLAPSEPIPAVIVYVGQGDDAGTYECGQMYVCG